SSFCLTDTDDPRDLHPFPTRRSSDLASGATPSRSSSTHSSAANREPPGEPPHGHAREARRQHHEVPDLEVDLPSRAAGQPAQPRSEEHTSELQSLAYLVCRLLLEKKN